MDKLDKALKVIYDSQDIMGGKDEFWKAYRVIEKAIKALKIIKENCSIYTESLYPLGPAEVWNVYLNMRGYIADKEKEEKFDLLKEVLK